MKITTKILGKDLKDAIYKSEKFLEGSGFNVLGRDIKECVDVRGHTEMFSNDHS